MPRLERGQNEKIDRINDLVYEAMGGNDKSMEILLEMFRPMILKICKKWSDYFNDKNHRIKAFDELIADAEYWFVRYTLLKYDIDGSATYNTFIRNHIDQRIRYIYATELKYYRRLVFPDPDRNNPDDSVDMLESVIYGYTSDHGESLEDSVIHDDHMDSRMELARKIVCLLDNDVFSSRDKLIFTEIICNGRTHEEISKELNVSRTRITQILKKIKLKLYRIMNNSQDIWDLINETDIEFKEM